MTLVAGPTRSNARMTSSWYHLRKSHLRRMKNGTIRSLRPGSVRNRGQRSMATACVSMNIPSLLRSRPIPPSDLAARVEIITCDMDPRPTSSAPLMAVGGVTPTLARVQPRFSPLPFPTYVANSHRDFQLFVQGLRTFSRSSHHHVMRCIRIPGDCDPVAVGPKQARFPSRYICYVIFRLPGALH